MSSFDIFWVTYPKRIGKGAALKSWDKALTRGVAPEDMIEGARKYLEFTERTHVESSFIAHPSTWLNQERWLDEHVLPPVQAPAVDLVRRWEQNPDRDYPTAMALFPHIKKPKDGYVEPHVCEYPGIRSKK